MMTLKTRWADTAMCDMPLPEYPRPQMIRDCWMNLNGFFDFAITDDSKDWCDEYTDKIRVPYVVFLGEDEINQSSVSVKDMISGEQKILPYAEAVAFIKAGIDSRAAVQPIKEK